MATFINNKTVLKITNTWKEHCILWQMDVAPPTVQKKTPSKQIIREYFLKPQQEALRGDNKERIAIYKQQKAKYDQQIAKLKQGKNFDSELIDEPVEPNIDYLCLDDITIEALIKKQSKSSWGISLFYDEASGLLKGLNQYKKSGNDVDYLLKAFNGLSHDKVRVKDEDIYIKSTHHSIMGGIQPEVLNELMFKNALDNGFTERWLYYLSTHFDDGSITMQDVDESLINKCQQILFEIESNILSEYRLSQGAFAIWEAANKYNINLAKKKNTQRLLGSYLGKMNRIQARLALCFHCITNPKDVHISKENMEQAIRLSCYFIETFKSILNQQFNSISDGIEKYILDYIHTKELTKLSPTDLTKINRSKFPNAEVAKGFMLILEHKGYLKKHKNTNRGETFYVTE